jgi:hypothetical protein
MSIMRVIQIGNFGPEHSTENHLLRALRSNDVEVWPMQENDPATFATLANGDWPDVDWVLWTRTGWDWDSFYPGGRLQAIFDQRKFLRRCRGAGIPTVGYHLDIWWGLGREQQVWEEPFFECSVVITADGGHSDEWQRAGVNHVWMAPGVSAPECEPGHFDPEMHSKLAFVGSWQGGYHTEHQHRYELVEWLKRNFRQHCEFWPRLGQPAVRGEALRNLYASVDVLIGDSCFAGQVPNYWSDRIPETVGRGGLLIHPDVPGLNEQFTPGEHLLTWQAGDWDALGAQIEYALSNPTKMAEIRAAGRAHVVARHTYEVRMRQVVELLFPKPKQRKKAAK